MSLVTTYSMTRTFQNSNFLCPVEFSFQPLRTCQSNRHLRNVTISKLNICRSRKRTEDPKDFSFCSLKKEMYEKQANLDMDLQDRNSLNSTAVTGSMGLNCSKSKQKLTQYILSQQAMQPVFTQQCLDPLCLFHISLAQPCFHRDFHTFCAKSPVGL